MGDLTMALVVLLGALGVGGSIYGMAARSRRMAQDWAARNGLELEALDVRLFRRGPFWWSGKGQVVYRMAARDEEGRLRHGWLCCGGWLLGVMEDKVEARWDG